MNTAQDLVYHLLSTTGGGAQDGEHAALRQAVVHGVREVMQARDWLWHQRQESMTARDTNTTTYQLSFLRPDSLVCGVNDATGLNVGDTLECPNIFSSPPKIAAIYPNFGFSTSPSGAVSYQPALLLDKAPVYKSDDAFGSVEQIAAKVYPYHLLPAGLRSIDALVSDETGVTLTYVTPQEYQRLASTQTGTAEPFFYTVMRSPNYPDYYEIRFVYTPPAGDTFLYTYRYAPPPIRNMGYERRCRQGVIRYFVTGINSQLSYVAFAYGTDTNFPTQVENAVLRVGTSDEFPEPIGSLTPYQYEFRLLGTVSPTTLSLEMPRTYEPILGSAAEPVNLQFSISDEVDCSPQMWTAVLSACEMWFARLAGKSAEGIVQLFNRDLRLAMETDRVASLATNGPSAARTPRSMGWHSTMLSDIG